MLKTTALPSGETVPTLGQGTWSMGEDSRLRRTEADALSKAGRILPAIDGVMDVDQAAATSEELVDIAGTLRRPGALLVKDKYVGRCEVILGRPGVGSGHARLLSHRE